MKGTHLGEFQEIVLLTIMVLDEEAYGVSIKQEINQKTNRNNKTDHDQYNYGSHTPSSFDVKLSLFDPFDYEDTQIEL